MKELPGSPLTDADDAQAAARPPRANAWQGNPKELLAVGGRRVCNGLVAVRGIGQGFHDGWPGVES